MLLIRRTEERLATLFADGEVPGFIHLSIGQEAVSAGVMSNLTKADTIASTHRGHGHALAKGLSLEGFFSELLARREGLCQGRGGSMHVADMSVGMLGANGIVGAGLSIALGSALAHKRLRPGTIAVAFFGDGALAEGLLHETLNMAALWKLPLLFVCENNGWSEFLPSEKQIAFTLERLSAAYAIPYERVDGNDAEAVALRSREIIEAVRRSGPAVLECATVRVRGHFEGDAQKYRDRADLEDVAKVDPIMRCEAVLKKTRMSDEALQALDADVRSAIENAISVARAGQDPDFERAREDVYTPQGFASP
nr:thiamine pyrophosphate-dependent dehydrogenase E1 component subunit alpha [Alsobacter ponti]